MMNKSFYRNGLPFFALLALLLSLCSCDTSRRISKDFTYFQQHPDSMGKMNFREIVIQPNDLLDIYVFSKSLNQEQAILFNLPNVSTGAGGSRNTTGYLVNLNGTIDIPFAGTVQASGLTRSQLSSTLVTKLTPYVKEPTVIVRFLQYKVNVLGEVKSPGTYNFATDRVTIFDALSAAGDLTDVGRRTDVMVVREEGGTRKYYPVNLNSGALFQSPVFQLQQNDVVYVQANANKLSELDVNPKAQRNLQLGFTLASFAVLLINLFFTIKNN